MAEKCPVCKAILQDDPIPSRGDEKFFDCPRCGEFVLSGTLFSTLPGTLQDDKNASAKISYAIRSMQKSDQEVKLDTQNIKPILETSLPRPSEQADLLLRWVAENIGGPGETVAVNPHKHSSVIGSKTPEGFELILRYLMDMDLLIGNMFVGIGPFQGADVTLSIKGWNYYEQLLKGRITYHKAFMAMKFGDLELDEVFEEVLKPSTKQVGFELIRLTDVPRAGLIDDRLRVEIQASDFLIADLTHDNPGAYWEAGYAEGLGKPVIYTCEKEKFETHKTHFDTNHHLTVIWDKKSPTQAGDLWKATIRATLPHLAKQSD